MTSSEESFGAILCVEHAGDSTPVELVSRLSNNIAGIPVRLYSTMRADSDKASRYRKLDEKSLALIVDEVRAGSLSHVMCADRATPLYATEYAPYCAVSIEVETYQMRGRAHGVELIGPRDSWHQAEMLSFLKSICADFNVMCGRVLAQSTSTDTLSLLTFLQISQWIRDAPPDWLDPRQPLNSEMAFYQRNEELLDRYVPRGYWGNVLSPAHVAGLGGEEKIRESCPCCLVERWGPNLFLQLTDSPWNVSVADLKQLDAFLSPIRLRGAPEPVYVL